MFVFLLSSKSHLIEAFISGGKPFLFFFFCCILIREICLYDIPWMELNGIFFLCSFFMVFFFYDWFFANVYMFLGRWYIIRILCLIYIQMFVYCYYLYTCFLLLCEFCCIYCVFLCVVSLSLFFFCFRKVCTFVIMVNSIFVPFIVSLLSLFPL